MKRILTGLALLAATLVFSCSDTGSAEKESASISNDSLIKRGLYLVTIGGCNDCHSPKIMSPMGPVIDSTRILSGFRSDGKLPEINKEALKQGWMLANSDITGMVTPMGVAFAANITSDETGIGNWSFEQFKTALTKGKWKGLENSRNLLPPMPWMNFVNMREDDLKAIFAYLKSTTPVSNRVPDAIPADKI